MLKALVRISPKGKKASSDVARGEVSFSSHTHLERLLKKPAGLTFNPLNY